MEFQEVRRIAYKTIEEYLNGRSSINTTTVGNINGGTDDLMTYSLPADSLSSGRAVRVYAWGFFENNANSKTVTIKFGAATIVTGNLSSDGYWELRALISFVGTDSQAGSGSFSESNGSLFTPSFPVVATEDDGAAITIKCTGAATATNDIVQKGMLVELVG